VSEILFDDFEHVGFLEFDEYGRCLLPSKCFPAELSPDTHKVWVDPKGNILIEPCAILPLSVVQGISIPSQHWQIMDFASGLAEAQGGSEDGGN
jgi:hypothetical protein